MKLQLGNEIKNVIKVNMLYLSLLFFFTKNVNIYVVFALCFIRTINQFKMIIAFIS